MAWSCAVVAGIWLACLALLFQGVGFAIPFWLNGAVVSTTGTGTSTSVLNYYVSIWYSMACTDGESSSCKSKPITPRFDTDLTIASEFSGNTEENVVETIDIVLGHLIVWTIVQLAATLATGLTSLAVLIIICCRCAGIHSKCFIAVAGVCLLFGGLGAMLIAILMAIFIAYTFDFVSGEGLSERTFPYSILVFGIGGIIGFIAAIFFFVICCKWKKYGEYYRNAYDEGRMADDVAMSKISRSRESKLGYDRPRQRDYERDQFHDDRNYRNDRNGYEKKSSSGRPEYREYENRGYDRGHEKSYDRGYTDANSSPYRYTTSENMYRPYRY